MQFDEIYVKYFNDVYRFLLRLSGNKDIAEEITSETFFKAMKSICSIHGDLLIPYIAADCRDKSIIPIRWTSATVSCIGHFASFGGADG